MWRPQERPDTLLQRTGYAPQLNGNSDRRIEVTAAMRPGQVEPNELEPAILERLASKEPSIRRYVGHLHVLSREFMGVGSFTNFACEEPVGEAPDQQVGLDESIKMPGVPNGMGAVLFCKGGKPQCFEVFTYGDDRWEGVYDGFAIEQSA